MVDVHHFLSFLVHGRVGKRPADPGGFGEVDDALELYVVELRTNQRVDPRRIDRIAHQFFDNPDPAAREFVEPGDAALDRSGLFQARITSSSDGESSPCPAPGNQRAKDRRPLVARWFQYLSSSSFWK